RQIEKIKLEDVKPSSRQNPYIRFDYDAKNKLHRVALGVEKLSKGFDGKFLFKNLNILLEAGDKLAVIGPNGAGKTTLLKTLLDEYKPDQGEIKWAEKARISYYAQDHNDAFEFDKTLFEWMHQWAREGDDDQVIRGMLGRLLF